MKKHLLLCIIVFTTASGYAQRFIKKDSIWKPKIEIGSNIIWLIKPDLQANISPYDDLWETHSGKTPMGNVFVRIHRPWKKKKGALRLRFEGAFYDFDSLNIRDDQPRFNNAAWVNVGVGWEHYFVQKKHINLYGFTETGYGLFWGKKTFKVNFLAWDRENGEAWVQSPQWYKHTINLDGGVGLSIQLLDHIRIGTELTLSSTYSTYSNPEVPTINYDTNELKTEGTTKLYLAARTNEFSLKIMPFQTIYFTLNF